MLPQPTKPPGQIPIFNEIVPIVKLFNGYLTYIHKCNIIVKKYRAPDTYLGTGSTLVSTRTQQAKILKAWRSLHCFKGKKLGQEDINISYLIIKILALVIVY